MARRASPRPHQDTQPSKKGERGEADASNPRKELVRDELVDKATDIFFIKGYAQTGMNDIAAELGLRRSSIYHYFANKDDLLAAILEKETSRPYQEVLHVVEMTGLTATQKLRRVVAEGIVRRLKGKPRFMVLNRLEADMPEHLAVLYSRSKRQILDLYCRIIEDGIRAGEFRNVDVRMAAFAVIGMANWTSWWYSSAGKMKPEEIAEAITDIALNGLAQDANGQKPPDSLGAAIRALKDNVLALERLTR